MYHLLFVVQSSALPAPAVASRVHAFISSYVPTLLSALTPSSFAAYASAAAERLLEPPKRLSAAADDAWDAIEGGGIPFDWDRQVAAALPALTPAAVQSLWNATATLGGGGRLLVLVHGAKDRLATPPPPPPPGYERVTAGAFRAAATYY